VGLGFLQGRVTVTFLVFLHVFILFVNSLVLELGFKLLLLGFESVLVHLLLAHFSHFLVSHLLAFELHLGLVHRLHRSILHSCALETRDEGFLMVQFIVVLSTSEELFLLLGEVVVRVDIGFVQDLHVPLEVSDLLQIVDKCLGYLLY
jgi:hypothetical protein